MTHHERDFRDMSWLHLHDQGYTSGQIAKLHDSRPEYVRVVLNRIKDAVQRSEAHG